MMGADGHSLGQRHTPLQDQQQQEGLQGGGRVTEQGYLRGRQLGFGARGVGIPPDLRHEQLLKQRGLGNQQGEGGQAPGLGPKPDGTVSHDSCGWVLNLL